MRVGDVFMGRGGEEKYKLVLTIQEITPGMHYRFLYHNLDSGARFINYRNRKEFFRYFKPILLYNNTKIQVKITLKKGQP